MGTGTESGLASVSQKILNAICSRDVASLGQVLADDFVHIGENGVRQSGAEFLAVVAGGDHTIKSLEFEHVAYEVFDEVGIVCGVQVAKVVLAGGEALTARTAFTDVFVWQEGEWRVRLVHSSDVSDQSQFAV